MSFSQPLKTNTQCKSIEIFLWKLSEFSSPIRRCRRRLLILSMISWKAIFCHCMLCFCIASSFLCIYFSNSALIEQYVSKASVSFSTSLYVSFSLCSFRSIEIEVLTKHSIPINTHLQSIRFLFYILIHLFAFQTWLRFVCHSYKKRRKIFKLSAFVDIYFYLSS